MCWRTVHILTSHSGLVLVSKTFISLVFKAVPEVLIKRYNYSTFCTVLVLSYSTGRYSFCPQCPVCSSYILIISAIDAVSVQCVMFVMFFIVQFLSAFLLLVCGSLVSLVLLACEHGYVRYTPPWYLGQVMRIEPKRYRNRRRMLQLKNHFSNYISPCSFLFLLGLRIRSWSNLLWFFWIRPCFVNFSMKRRWKKLLINQYQARNKT